MQCYCYLLHPLQLYNCSDYKATTSDKARDLQGAPAAPQHTELELCAAATHSPTLQHHEI